MSSRGPSMPVILLIILLTLSAFSLIPATQPGSPFSRLTSLSGPSRAEGFTLYSSCTFKIYSGFGSERKIVKEEPGGRKFNFKNQSGVPIWLAVIGDDYTNSTISDSQPAYKPEGWGKQFGFPGPNGTGPDWKNSWKIESGDTLSWCAPKHFASARMWPRTGCTEINGVFKCDTGDCLKTTESKEPLSDICTISGSELKTGSVVEFTVNAMDFTKHPPVDTNKIYYDLSFVDGYDFPIQITPQNTFPEDSCKEVACNENTLPADCLTTGGNFVGGVCLAPYRVFDATPSQTHNEDSNAIGAKCADQSARELGDTQICGCAVICDGIDGRAGAGFEPCPDTFTSYNYYREEDVTMRSAGCSPIAQYTGIKNTLHNQLLPGRFATFWKQTPCDPETDEGNYYAPYVFEFSNTLNPNPQGHRATILVHPPSGTWEASPTPQIRVKLADFHDQFSMATTGIIPSDDFAGIDTSRGKQVTVYVQKGDTVTDKISMDLKVMRDKTMAIDNDEITVAITDPDFIGKDYPVTINIAHRDFSCVKWPPENRLYVTTLHAQCPGAYTWQFDDLVGLSSCQIDTSDGKPKDPGAFDITFHPRPVKAGDLTTQWVSLSPTDKLPVIYTFNSIPETVIGPDTAKVAMKNGDRITIQPKSCPGLTPLPECTMTYNNTAQQLEYVVPDPPAAEIQWCKDLITTSKTPLTLNIYPPDDRCFLWNGRTIAITKQTGVTYSLKADDVEIDLTGKNITYETGYEAVREKRKDPQFADYDKLVKFSLKTICTPPDTLPATSIPCEATYSVFNKAFTLTKGAHSYCDKIFKPHFYGTLGLETVEQSYCASSEWTGDPIEVVPQAAPFITNIKIPANSINEDKSDATHVHYNIPVDQSMTVTAYCDNSGISDTRHKKAAICQATYSSSKSFTNILPGSSYCLSTFNLVNGQMTVTPPPPTTDCFGLTWDLSGDSVKITPAETDTTGIDLSVPGNLIDITVNKPDQFSIKIKPDGKIFVRQYCNPEKTSGVFCEATYSVAKAFTHINGNSIPYCESVFSSDHPGEVKLLTRGYLTVNNLCTGVSGYLKNETTGSLYSGTMQRALDEAKTGESLRALALEMLDSAGIIYNLADQSAVSIHGGYTIIDDATPTGYTTLRGPMVIRSGKLAVNRLKIK